MGSYQTVYEGQVADEGPCIDLDYYCVLLVPNVYLTSVNKYLLALTKERAKHQSLKPHFGFVES